MKKIYSEKDLKDLYRIDNKYWKTGDVDFLPARFDLGKKIDEKFWTEICGIVSIATRKHLSIDTVVDALSLLGYEMEKENVNT